jgi:formylmethanofuran dehydrogenase subunit E
MSGLRRKEQAMAKQRERTSIDHTNTEALTRFHGRMYPGLVMVIRAAGVGLREIYSEDTRDKEVVA